MKKLILLLLIVSLYNCSNDPKTMIPFVDGYWEIDEVTLSNGTKRDYTYNDTVDYIEISDNLTGFRKKLKPNFQGTFETSNNSEAFHIKCENDSLNIYYKTPYSDWKETVLNANETQLLIINANKDVYLYKRYEPLNID